ncbi:MAG: hypothetical protein K2N47_00500 [Clostridia bacterium]|nr:hypothetical protein [Clostridia bacterium]
MAEERLVDDDKDKKYRIKVNENGEEELVIDDGEEEASNAEEVVFDVPEVTEDNEEEALLTPEQLAIKREQEEQAKRERDEKIAELLQKAKKDCLLYKFGTTLEYLQSVEELDDTCGELYALKTLAYTRNFTDYTQIVDAAKSAEGLEKHTSAERKAELLEKGKSGLESGIASLRATITELNSENESKKEERAVKFERDRKKALIVFLAILGGFAVLISLTGGFASIMFSKSNGVFLVLTCIFGALALIALIALAFAARWLNITSRRIRLNKRNTTTKLGRELLARQEELRAYIAVYNALKG